jgi:hypothetical protein
VLECYLEMLGSSVADLMELDKKSTLSLRE